MAIPITREEYEKKFGVPPNVPSPMGLSQPVQQPKKGLLQKTTDVVTSIFPGKQVGEAIGTLGGYALSKNKEQFDISAPSPKQVLGDVAKGAALVGSAGVTPATMIVGKAAQFGGLGAIAGAGQAMTESKTLPEIGKQALKSGAIGAGVGATVGVAEKGIKGLANLNLQRK